MPKRLRAAVPLRVGLVAATLLLAACGLTASGIAVTSILRHSQIAGSTNAGRGVAAAGRRRPERRRRVRIGPTADRPPSNFYVRSTYPGRAHLDGRQRQQRRTCVARQQRRGPDADNSWLGGRFRHAMAGGVGARAARSVGHRRLRPFRFPADGPVAGLVAARALAWPCCWSWVWPAMGGAPKPATADGGRTDRRGDRRRPAGSPCART